MSAKTWEIDGLNEDRRVRADDVFERVNFKGIVADHEGWESFTGMGGPPKYNTWTKVVYFEDVTDCNAPSIRREFQVVFRPNSCVPVAAYLDGVTIPLPK